MEQLGKILVGFGVVIVLVGLLLTFADRLPFRLGRFPLDFRFERDNFSFYFPLGTSIVVSIVLSLVWMLLGRR